jgi:protease PrsW
MFVIILVANWIEQRNIINHLREEVQLGIISVGQYHTATSAWKQSFARLAALFSGKYLATNRFYQVVGELAHKKQQLVKIGDEGANRAIIQRYREELATLAPRAQI